LTALVAAGQQASAPIAQTLERIAKISGLANVNLLSFI